MNELAVFENPEFGKIRTVELDGEPWLVGKDVAAALGYANPSKAIIDHVDDEDKRFEMLLASDSQNGNLVKTALINESGLYSLVLSSKLPTARKFRRWVTSEVLPSIRKTGGYAGKPKQDSMNAEIRQKRANVMEMNAKARAMNQMTKLWTAAGVKAQYQALALNGYFDGMSLPREAFGEICTAMLDATAIADALGIMSKSGKPHARAVGAIISKLTLEPGECVMTPYTRNGHDGVAPQYTASVQDKVRSWLDANGWPSCIGADGSTYSVAYLKH